MPALGRRDWNSCLILIFIALCFRGADAFHSVSINSEPFNFTLPYKVFKSWGSSINSVTLKKKKNLKGLNNVEVEYKAWKLQRLKGWALLMGEGLELMNVHDPPGLGGMLPLAQRMNPNPSNWRSLGRGGGSPPPIKPQLAIVLCLNPERGCLISSAFPRRFYEHW